MGLTGHQRRLLKEIEQVADIAKLDYPQIEKAYAPEARTTILLLMKDKIVRGDVIVKCTLIEEFLTDIICDYYFKRRACDQSAAEGRSQCHRPNQRCQERSGAQLFPTATPPL